MAQAPTTFQTRYKESDFRQELILALRTYSYNLADIYKQKLIDEDVNATGTLITNILPYSGEVSRTEYVAGLRLESHWVFVEHGRKAGSKFPPRQSIIEWMQARNITPQPYTLPTGRTVIPTTSQIAFLISRKIAIEGITPRPFLQESVSEISDDLKNIVTEILGDAIKGVSLDFASLKI